MQVALIADPHSLQLAYKTVKACFKLIPSGYLKAWKQVILHPVIRNIQSQKMLYDLKHN